MESEDDEPATQDVATATAMLKAASKSGVGSAADLGGKTISLSKDYSTKHSGVLTAHHKHNAGLMDDDDESAIPGVRWVKGTNPGVGKSFLKAHFKEEAESVEAFIMQYTVVGKDGESGDTSIRLSMATSAQQHIGFGGYGHTYQRVHNAKEQEMATILFKKGWFKGTRGTPLHKLDARIRSTIKTMAKEDVEAVLIECHAGRQSSMASCYTSHQDKDPPALRHCALSATTGANDCKSAAHIVDDKVSMDYDRAGDTFIFPSDLYHYTSMASVGTLKIAFFYELRAVHKLDDSSAPSASSSGASTEETKFQTEETTVKTEGATGNEEPASKKAKVEA